MTVEALVEQKQVGRDWSGTLPAKGEVTAWLAATHRREGWVTPTRSTAGCIACAGHLAALCIYGCHTDKVNRRVHRRLRSVGTQTRFERLDQEQDGLCVHETVLPDE